MEIFTDQFEEGNLGSKEVIGRVLLDFIESFTHHFVKNIERISKKLQSEL
jgi:hypothetical protein